MRIYRVRICIYLNYVSVESERRGDANGKRNETEGKCQLLMSLTEHTALQLYRTLYYLSPIYIYTVLSTIISTATSRRVSITK